MNIIAKNHLANSSKDISNGGIFGTLIQLIQYSNVGADVNINKLKIPPILKENNYKLETFVKMYLTTSFILTASKSNSKKIIEIFKEYNLDARVIGKIIKEKFLLRINDGKEKIDINRD